MPWNSAESMHYNPINSPWVGEGERIEIGEQEAAAGSSSQVREKKNLLAGCSNIMDSYGRNAVFHCILEKCQILRTKNHSIHGTHSELLFQSICRFRCVVSSLVWNIGTKCVLRLFCASSISMATSPAGPSHNCSPLSVTLQLFLTYAASNSSYSKRGGEEVGLMPTTHL
ncbi:unnamed protein product [Caretta caretta]